MKGSPWRLPLRYVVLVYLALLVIVPVGAVFYHAFSPGLGKAWDAFTTPDGLHALLLTLIVVAIAVPLNTIFGVGVSIILARHPFPGAWLLDALIDIPLAVSPVIIGLSLILVYGQTGWWGNWLAAARHHHHLLRARHHHGVGGGVACPTSCARCCRCSRRSGPSRSRRPAHWGPGRSPSSAASRCPTSAGASPTASRSRRPACWASSAPSLSCRAPSPARPQTYTIFISESIDNLQPQAAYVGAVVLCLAALIVLSAS